MTKKNVFTKIEQSNNLPQLPQVMLKLIKACKNEQISVDELTEIISTDPSLTSRLLQMIGSAYINLPKEVNNIKTAVVYLGLYTIRNIAISSSAMHFFKLSKAVPKFNIQKFWYHSYKCAVIARRMAEKNNFPNPDEFFLVGLLHDIGKLILMQNFPDEYNAILKTSSNETQILAAEMEMFDTDTSQVSAWLFNQWNLNPLIFDAVLFVNETVEQVEGALSYVKVVYISNLLARQNTLETIPKILSLTDISQTILEQIVLDAEEEVLEMATSLGINPENVQDTIHDDSLTSEIKDLSLFYGTLQNLLHARDVESVLDIAHNGLKIVFNIPTVFSFLLDEKKNLLTGFCSGNDKFSKIINSIAIPLSNRTSLLVKCIKEQKVQNSLKKKSTQKLSISDIQIIRLLGTKSLFCIPLYSSQKASGVLVLGVDKTIVKNLEDNNNLIKLFSKQTGICLQNILFYQGYAVDIHTKKMEAYSTLTDKLIHEINNPIGILINYIGILGLKLPDKHPAQDELLIISEEMNRVAGLLENLRSFSGPKIGEFKSVNINKICQKMFEFLKKSVLLPRHIEASINLDPEIPKVKTDQNGLKQIFINLIKNAAEAMDKGGEIIVTTRFLSESTKILIDEKKQIPGSIEIVISDNGPGIDEKIKETLFEPYTTTKIGTSNSGLGLSIVYSIVKELNGNVICNTKKGKGTCFTITLPVSSSKHDKDKT